MDPHLRAGDADRERVVERLRRHVGEGRLTLDEFSDRAAAAYRARTLGELSALTGDLPGSTSTPVVTASHGFPVVPAIVTAALLVLLLTAALIALVGLRDAGPMNHMMDHMMNQ